MTKRWPPWRSGSSGSTTLSLPATGQPCKRLEALGETQRIADFRLLRASGQCWQIVPIQTTLGVLKASYATPRGPAEGPDPSPTVSADLPFFFGVELPCSCPCK